VLCHNERLRIAGRRCLVPESLFYLVCNLSKATGVPKLDPTITLSPPSRYPSSTEVFQVHHSADLERWMTQILKRYGVRHDA
jgi:hypothetical protein